jgi:hypothetical protein
VNEFLKRDGMAMGIEDASKKSQKKINGSSYSNS